MQRIRRGQLPGKPLIVMLFTALKMNAHVPIQRPRQQSVPNQMSADTTLRFDVLSVKLTVPSANPLEHRQIRNTDPGRVHYVNVGLKDIMMNAYSLKEYQVVGPDWLNMIAVDIDATMRAGTPNRLLKNGLGRDLAFFRFLPQEAYVRVAKRPTQGDTDPKRHFSKTQNTLLLGLMRFELPATSNSASVRGYMQQP